MGRRVRTVGRNNAGQVNEVRLRIETARHHVCPKLVGLAAVGADAIRLDAVVSIGRRLDHECIAHRALPAFVEVDGIVIDIDRSVIGHVDRAAEHLDTVIKHRVDLEVGHRGAATHSAKGNAVKLVAVTHGGAGVLDDNVVEAARAVLVVRPAVVVFVRASGPFRSHIALANQSEIHTAGAGVGALVGDAEAVDDHAPPLLIVFRSYGTVHIGHGGEGDRRRRRTNRHQLRAAVDHHELVVGLPREGRAGFHGHGRAVAALEDACCVHFRRGAVGLADEQAAFEDVSAAIGQCGEVDVDRNVVTGVGEEGRVHAVTIIPVGALARLTAAGHVGSAGIHGLLGRRGSGRVIAVGDRIVRGRRIDLDVTAAAAAGENRKRGGRNKGVLTNHGEPPGVSFHV